MPNVLPKPDTFTVEKAELFAQVLSETGIVRKACEAIGVTRMTAHNWRTHRAEFKLLWDNAMKIAVSVLEDEARRRAQEGCEKPVFHQGVQCGSVTEYSDTLAIFLLKAADPAKYRERVSLTGEDGGPIQSEVIIRKMFVPVEGDDGASQPPE